MKGMRKTYGLTICFLTSGLICFYLSVKVSPSSDTSYTVLLKDRYKVNVSSKDAVINFVNVLNNSETPKAWNTATSKELDSVITPQSSTRTDNDVVISRAHILAIVSYMRSGSTLTADIMQHFPGTVYVFEPLHTVSVRTRMNKPLIYLNGTVVKLKPEDLTDEYLKGELHKWFNCRYHELDVHSLTDSFHTHFSRSMRKLSECWKPKKRTLRSISQCLPDAIKMCQAAKHRLFKFIRIPMNIVKNLFISYPNLQIVHLIRDPRGSLSSQIRLHKSTWSEVKETSKNYCQQIESDIHYTLQLHEQYPTRAKILLYENLAEDPVRMAKLLYKFANLPVFDYVINYVRKLTQAGKQSKNPFGIIRSDSRQTAYKWRNEIEFQNVLAIDSNCKKVYKALGYQRFTEPHHVRNSLQPSHITPNTSVII